MSGRRGWTFVTLGVVGLWLGSCRDTDDPSASEREGRSDVLRGLMASKERAPEKLKGPSQLVPQPLPPEPQPQSGQGGSGRPEAQKRIEGQVSWVGDNDLLVRDAQGTEHDFEVNGDTRLLRGNDSVSLVTLHPGNGVRVSYDEGPGGLVARQVEVLPASDSSPTPEDTAQHDGGGPRAGETQPLR
jgi:hypothetical protein